MDLLGRWTLLLCISLFPQANLLTHGTSIVVNHVLETPISVLLLHTLLVLHQRKHELCVLPFQNMLLLLPLLLMLCFLLYLVVTVLLCLPLGLIFSFIRCRKVVITCSQYQEATELTRKEKDLKKAAESHHPEERSGSQGRKIHQNMKSVEKEVLQLEDVKLLEEMYPQGENAKTTRALSSRIFGKTCFGNFRMEAPHCQMLEEPDTCSFFVHHFFCSLITPHFFKKCNFCSLINIDLRK
ncbi:hypothetical protein VNO78_25686 [Psophocarpus tetragonolobus]|uniref:Uncharacterized protein n=1 Tax=Psophocarpus tetragonolobus TaxID=3891 RepID=A0AAN9S7D3_PSOTE